MRPAWVNSRGRLRRFSRLTPRQRSTSCTCWLAADWLTPQCSAPRLMLLVDRKSTRLKSSHLGISYAGFCLDGKVPYGLGGYQKHAPGDEKGSQLHSGCT